jgi:ribosomal protein S18 acetylase RimI-like enzyme
MADLIRQREGDFDGQAVENALADLVLISAGEAVEGIIREAMANNELLQETFDELYESKFDPDLAEQDGYDEHSEYVVYEVFAEMANNYRAEIADVYVETNLSDTMQNTFNLEHDSSGIYSQIENVSATSAGNIRVYGYVYSPEGNEIGEFARTFYPTRSGGIRAEHDIFQISDPDYQGRGFGRFFTDNVEAAYISGGVEKINLFSAWDGAYTWSRAGYDFDPRPFKLADSIGSMNNANWRFSEFSEGDKAKYEDLVERSASLDLKDPRFPFPHEYASLPGAKDVLYNEKVHFEKVLSAEGTRLREQPIDADGDGMIFDGTARERPAPASTKKP